MVESNFSSSLRLNQKGQGMIEYLLLLFITVTMILLAMANLFKPMQGFLQNFMGTYVACLLTSGELPAIRVENTMKDADPKCSFSMTGKNGNGANGGDGSNGANGNNPNGNKDGSDANESAGDSAGKDGGPGSGGYGDGGNGNGGRGAAYAGSRGRRGGFGKSSFLRRSADGGGVGEEADGGKRYVNNLDKNKGDRFFRGRQKTTQLSNRYSRSGYLIGMTEEEQKKIERKIQSTPRSLPKATEEFSVPGRKSIVKPPPEKKKIVVNSEDESFTLGGFFKYVLIAIILLLILIVGGGQAFEMSKTMD